MRFGNTLFKIPRGVVVMALLGVTLGIIGFVSAIAHGTTARTWPIGVLLIFMPPGVFFLACAPTLLFSVHVGGGRVKHLLLDRFVLSDLPIAAFERVEWVRGPLPVVIHFTQGRTIRFVGMHLGMIGVLKAALEQEKVRANHSAETTRGR